MAKSKIKRTSPKAVPEGLAQASAATPKRTEPFNPSLFSKEWIQVGTVLLVAFALRLINVLFMQANSPFFDGPVTDADFYDKLAVAISNGDWLGKDVFFFNPFYPYLLGVIYTVFGHSYLAAKLIQIVVGTTSCLLIYFLAKRLLSRKEALLAASLAAGYSIFIYYDELLLAASVSMFTFLSALLLLLRAIDKPAAPRFAVAGAVLGISFVSRPSVFPFVAAFWIVFSLRKQPKLHILSRLAVYGFTAALMVLPVTLRNYVVGEDVVLVSSHTGYNLYFGSNPDAGGYFSLPREIPRTLIDSPEDQKKWFTEEAEKNLQRTLKPSEVSQYWGDKGWTYIKEHPGEWTILAFKKLFRILNAHEFSDNQNYYFSKQYSPLLRLPLVGFGLVCPLALLGMVLLFRRFEKLGILYLYIVGYAGALLFFFVSSRYRMPMVPVFILFAAHGAVWIEGKLTRRDFKPFLKAAVLLALFTAIVFIRPEGASEDPQAIDYYNVGNKYLKKAQFDDAIDAFSTSIQMNPGYISAHNNLASAYEQAGRVDDALERWRKVLKMGERINSKMHIDRARQHIDRMTRKKANQRMP